MFYPQLNYREAYHKEKHIYTTVLDTHDYARCFNLKEIYSTVSLHKNLQNAELLVLFVVLVSEISLCTIQKAYSAAWDKIKAKSYSIPHDSHALVHAKQQKVVLSNVSLFTNPFSNSYCLHRKRTA